MRLTILLVLTLFVAGCQSASAPCDCSVMETQLREYTDRYIDALVHQATLRQQLKACEERPR